MPIIDNSSPFDIPKAPKPQIKENLKNNSILEKDIVSSIHIEEDEINPHNEISGMDDSHAICESLISN